jgi:hypothetical protein
VSGTRAIEVDVSRHRPCSQSSLHDDTVKAVLPKGSAHSVSLVKPSGMALQKPTQVDGSIPPPKSQILRLKAGEALPDVKQMASV